MEQYKCHKCNKLIDEEEGITTKSGLFVCDDNTCRTLDVDNEAQVSLH